VYAAPGESWISRNREALISAFTVSLVMVVLGYDFITNARGIKSSSEIIWVSFTRLPQRDNALSYGVLSMLLTSWFFISLVFAAEHSVTEARQWWKGFAITLGVSAGIALFYWFFHAQGLAAIANNTANSFDQVLTQVSRFERLISRFYFAGILVVLWLAVVLTDDHLVEKTAAHRWSPFGAALILISVIAGAVITNIRVVQADIVFKIAEPFTRSGQWQVAIAIYNRANELAPHEDYYFLFLGRAFLEHAKTLPTETEKDRFFQDAELELKKAQSLNPLNTDHTANLARLYSMWASFAQETETRQQRGNVSSEYFSRALALSRNSAMLWDEWATLYLFTLQQPEEALEKLARAKEIDPKYHRTYALLAEYYLRKAVAENDATAQREAFLQAAENLKAALQMSTTGEPSAKFNYAQMLAGAYVQLSQLPDAIESYLAAIQYAPSGVALWQIHEALARLYAQVGDPANATIHLQYALQDAPDDQTSRLQTLGELISAGGQP
jgi:tetratricopeptide (TPR) repeat protein